MKIVREFVKPLNRLIVESAIAIEQRFPFRHFDSCRLKLSAMHRVPAFGGGAIRATEAMESNEQSRRLKPLPLSTISARPSVNPNGIPSQSRGLARRAPTLGKTKITRSTLKGLRHGAPDHERRDATQFGLKNTLRSAPRVGARRANPGLYDAIPLGLCGGHSPSPC